MLKGEFIKKPNAEVSLYQRFDLQKLKSIELKGDANDGGHSSLKETSKKRSTELKADNLEHHSSLKPDLPKK